MGSGEAGQRAAPTTPSVREIRTIATRHGLRWGLLGHNWVINGEIQHWSHGPTTKGEKTALAAYLSQWGEDELTDEEVSACYLVTRDA